MIPTTRRLRLSAVVLAAAVIASSVVPAAPASAADVVVIEGVGYGHGRGMSQHGARGAADAGLSWTEILGFYYPGTTRTTQAATRIRVRLSTGTSSAVTVDSTSSLAVDTGLGGETFDLPTGPSYAAWRLRLVSTGVVLESSNGSGGWAALTPPIALTTRSGFLSDGTVVVHRTNGTYQEVRGGEVRAAPASSGLLYTVAAMEMEDYLRSVVPREIPASWHVQALRAQAVAARSYAAREIHEHASRDWDTCDTTACQVFAGVAQYDSNRVVTLEGEHARTDAAIADTARVILVYQGIPAFTQFSSSNGGYSEKGSQPYLTAKADPYDGRLTDQSWSAALTRSDLERAYPSVGRLRGIAVLARDGGGPWGGRVISIRIAGTSGSTTVSGASFRSAMGLRSTLFRVAAQQDAARDWNGDGFSDLLGISGDGRLRTYLGRSTGGVTTGPQIGYGWNGMDVVLQVEDWDGRGQAGLIARERTTGYLYHYRAKTSTSFYPRVRIGHGWSTMDQILATDWDNDGVQDLVARERATGDLWLYPGRGDGRFLERKKIGHGWEVMDLIVVGGDWTGNGLTSLVCRDSAGRLWLYPANGRGRFLARSQVGHGWALMPQILSSADWDQDAVPDVLAVDSVGRLWLYPGNGDGRLGARRQVGAGWSGYRLID